MSKITLCNALTKLGLEPDGVKEAVADVARSKVGIKSVHYLAEDQNLKRAFPTTEEQIDLYYEYK